MKLFAELQSYAVELESTPAPSFGRNRLYDLALLEEIPAHQQSWLPQTPRFLKLNSLSCSYIPHIII